MTSNPSLHHHAFQSSRRTPWAVALLAVAGLAFGSASTQAQNASISIPNYSFETQSGVGFPFGTNPFVDNWAKKPEPAYFAPISAMYGIPWYGTAGAFIGTSPNSPNPYTNLLGDQGGYILGFPQVALFQDASSSPTFNPTYEVGKNYMFTLGVFGKPTLASSSTLALSLYYRDTTNALNDPLGEIMPINSTPIYYSAATFVNSATPSLIDYQVGLGTVQPTDLWAGKPIGIKMESVDPNPTGGNWDFDNARLNSAAAVPEPTTAGLLALGLGGLLFRRSRRDSRP